MSDDAIRTNAYLNAISDIGRSGPDGDPQHWVRLSTRVAIAEACMSVADTELRDASHEVERLRAVVAVLEAQGWAALVTKKVTS